ncbi:TonB-dependent receptor [Altericroceibacterium endophyticum]|uniref:TonB-dependent receptor n=1 Tax=Altericroceibacterium endophyticum TaxID=1808508 RepID=A0A6I4T2V1_9SPHN|nr:TonB-dependent receptor [Altericroceibacterium endophyticum]MXO64551.1 TonB-dependent receptor [Altericroceibacterium endophyticum]
MPRYSKRYVTMLASVSLASLVGVALASPAAAQSAPSEDEAQEITVTGVRASLQSAAQEKKNAVNVIDAITSEDIGKFPTENVADASQRITGVQITRTRGSGTAASIRGLPTDFTRVELNGSTLASSIVDLRGGGAGGDINRSFDFRLLPTEFVQTLEVVKSPTAELQEGGLSGTINVKTVRPLSLGKQTLVASAFGVWNSNAGKVTPQASALFSTTFGGGRGGFLIAGGYSDTRTETHSVNTIGWGVASEGRFGDVNGDGDTDDQFNLPSQVRTEIAKERRRRAVLTSVLEYELTDNLKVYTEGFYSRFHVQVDSLENLNLFVGANGGEYAPSTTALTSIDGIAPSQLTFGLPFATTIGLRGVDVRANNRYNNSVATTYYAKAGAEWESYNWRASANYAHSQAKQAGDNLGFAQIQRFDVTQSCEPGQALCGLSLSPESEARYLDPSVGVVASINGAYGRKTEDQVDEFKANLSYSLDDSFLRRIAIGGAATWRATYANADSLVVPAGALALTAGLTSNGAGGYGIVPYSQIAGASRGDFLGAYSGDVMVPSQWLSTDIHSLMETVSRDELGELSGAILLTNPSSVVDLKERTLAAYVQADFATGDDGLSGNIGARIVNTRGEARGVSPDLQSLVINVDTGGTVTVPPAGPISAKNTYTYVLPSANLKYALSDSVQLRFAASRTLSRPTLTQISPSTSVSGTTGAYTVNTGNPSLKPFLSTNFDAGIEWYPDLDTSLTFSGFYKNLASLVYPQTDSVILPVTLFYASSNTSVVEDQTFQRTRPVNGSGVKVKGFEVGFQKAFTFLPGPLKYTGTQLNYTFISNNQPQVLTAASKNNFNASAYYDDGRFATRVSYTWRDKFVSQGLPSSYFGLGVTTQPRASLDLSVSYQLNDEISIVLEGSNVLDNVDASRTTLGDLPVDYYDPGHQFMLGARIKL